MTDIEQVKAIKLILMSGLVLWMFGAPLVRAFTSKAEQVEGSTPSESDDDISESDRQAARPVVREAAFSFAVHWREQHGVQPDLLNEFADLMNNIGLVETLTLDASLLNAKGCGRMEMHQILLKANHYLFMTWRKYPFEQDINLVKELEKECLDAGLSTIKKMAPVVRQKLHKVPSTPPEDVFTNRSPNSLKQLDNIADYFGKQIEGNPALRQVLADEQEISFDHMEKLIKLDEFRKQGVLTDDEFDAKKKLILQTN